MKDQLSQDTVDIIERTVKEHENGDIPFEEMKKIIIADLSQRQHALMEQYKRVTGEELDLNDVGDSIE